MVKFIIKRASVVYQGLFIWYVRLNNIKKELLLYSRYLKPGRYEFLIESGHLIVVKHECIKKIPETLQSTISGFWGRRQKMSRLGNLIMRSRTLLDKLRTLIKMSNVDLVIPSADHDSMKPTNAQIGLLRSSGKVLLIDVNNKLVYTKFSNRNKTFINNIDQSSEMFGYTVMKNELSKYFSLPIDRGIVGCFYCQDLINGVAFSDFNTSERIEIIKEICCSVNKLSMNSELVSTVNSFDLLTEGFRLALLYVRRPEILRYIESRQEVILGRSKSWKMVASHCDLTAHNITILEKHPVLLDLAPRKLGFAPDFLMPLCLIHSEATEYNRPDLIIAFLNGKMDDEFGSLCGIHLNKMDNNIRSDLIIAETLVLASIRSKISPQNIDVWLNPVFQILKNLNYRIN